MKEQANLRATKLADVLAEEGRKARWLADRAQVSESHLSRVVNGERLVTPSVAERIAAALGRSLFLLFELTSESDELTGERAA